MEAEEARFCFGGVRCHEPAFFLGGTIDDKKGMRGHGMGCQNGPKNEHELSTLPQKNGMMDFNRCRTKKVSEDCTET